MDALLQSILHRHAAPFRETHVISHLWSILEANKVPFFQDSVGNLVIGANSLAAYRKKIAASSSLRVFVAHMDHPGFHGVKWKGPKRLEAKWFGGSPLTDFKGSRVWVSTQAGWAKEHFGNARVIEGKLLKSGRALERLTIEFDASFNLSADLPATEIFGGFSFRAPAWEKKGLIYTKSADDLIGAYAIVRLAIALKNKPAFKNFVGLLTRAEEVGFIGCIGHWELGLLQKAKRPILCISLETSRTLPGALIGKGPVLRLGDRRTVFDADALQWFKQIAEKKKKAGKLKHYQMRIMDGGTCEGTVGMTYGVATVGISVPLGNYHNQNVQGGPDSRKKDGPAPEFVATSDIEGLFQLAHGLVTETSSWDGVWKPVHRTFQKSLRASRKLLREGF